LLLHGWSTMTSLGLIGLAIPLMVIIIIWTFVPIFLEPNVDD
jgi:hypothetical protein